MFHQFSDQLLEIPYKRELMADNVKIFLVFRRNVWILHTVKNNELYPECRIRDFAKTPDPERRTDFRVQSSWLPVFDLKR